MNKLVSAVVIAAAVAIPAISFAQSAQPVTRAQVRAELVQLEKAGYTPSADDVNYPQELQAAQQRVDQEKLAQGDASGYGSPAAGTTAAGSAAHSLTLTPQQSELYGH